MKRSVLLGVALSFAGTALYAQSIDDAKKAIDAEKYAEAKKIASDLVAKQRKRGDNYFVLGQVYLLNEYPDSAKTIFEQGVAADPKSNLNKVGLGIVELYNGNTSGAESTFASVTGSLKKKDYLELYHIGRAHLDAEDGDVNKAIKYLEEAKLKNTQDPLVPLALGDAYFKLQNNSLAYKYYREASLLDNSLTRAKVQLAVIARGSHAWQEAIDGLKAIAAETPDYAPTYRELADTYHIWSTRATTSELYDERNAAALDYYKQYMSKTDYSLENRIRYADFLVYAHDYEELQVQAAELAKIEDVNPKVLRYLGYAAFNNGEYGASKEALDKMFAQMESSRIIAQDYFHLGLVDLKVAAEKGDDKLVDEGVYNLQKAVDKDSTIADKLQEHGLVFYTDRQYANAAKVFEVAANTESSRNHVTDNYYYALAAYNAVNQAVEAGEEKDIELLKKSDKAFAVVIEKAPDILEPYKFRAFVNKLIDDEEQSQGLAAPFFEAYYEKAKAKGGAEFETAKNDLANHYNGLAYANINNEQYEAARGQLAQTLKYDPENAWAKETIVLLQP